MFKKILSWIFLICIIGFLIYVLIFVEPNSAQQETVQDPMSSTKIYLAISTSFAIIVAILYSKFRSYSKWKKLNKKLSKISLNENEKTIINLLKKQDGLTFEFFQEELSLTDMQLNKLLKKLQNKNIIKTKIRRIYLN